MTELLDEWAIDVVCSEKVPMRLRGADRVEAIRRLSGKGMQPKEIGRLVKSSGSFVSQLQALHHIEPPEAEALWWRHLAGSGCRRRGGRRKGNNQESGVRGEPSGNRGRRMQSGH